MREYSQEQKELLGALIGLARSLDESNSTFEAFSVMREALCSLDSGEALSAWTEKVREAKFKAVPDCAVCKNPCGKTFDYDLSGLEKLDGEVRELKYKILAAAEKYARGTDATSGDFQPALEKLRAALFAAGYDYFTAEQMKEKISDIEEEV